MIRKYWRTVAVLASLFVTVSSANAQLPQTRLYALTPIGGQTGQEFDVTILAGDDLEEIDQMVFSNPKITARQKMTEQQTPVANTFVVTVPGDVAPGVYEVRVGGLFGFSNPRRFAVDRHPVAADPADNNTPEKAAPFEVGQVVNGRLESGNDVDWFRVSARQGQRIVFDVWAERLDSKMNPMISIFDSTGRRRLDWSRNSIGYDPVLVFDVPADGDYCILLHDVTYKNGNEYSYRLHATTDPHVEYVWPPSGKAGTKSQFTLFGYNLPGGQKLGQTYQDVELESLNVEIQLPAQVDLLNVENRVRPYAAGTDAFSYRFEADGKVSNPVRIGISPYDVVREIEPNNEAANAQQVTVPVEIGGQFAQLGDSDSFRFEAKAGEVVYVEAISERLGTNADPYLIVNQVIRKDDGTEEIKRLTAQDDVATNLLPNVFETVTDDPVFRLQVPADGTYEVVMRDRYWESRGHPLLRYSLTIRKETPDFRVVAVPAAPTAGQTWPTGLRKGDQFPLNLLAFRQDGFNGPIEVSAANLPNGLTCAPVVIGQGETASTLVVTSTGDAPVGIHEIQLKSSAKIEDPALARAVPEAEKAVENAAKPIADLEKKLNEAVEKVKQPQANYDTALKASQDAPDNADLKTKADAAKTALDQAVAQKDAAEKAVNDAKAALAAAQQAVETSRQAVAASVKTIEHPVRTGTVAWSTAGNFPASSRMTHSLMVTVLPEVAPFQLTSEPVRVTANQSRQILVPIKLEKRDGFDDKVTLTAQGVPKNSNLDFPNAEIAKGEAEKMIRLFVKDNTPPGTYTVWMRATGQVGYRRNPGKAERLKAENEAAKVKADEAKAAEQAATKAKTDATTAFTQAQQKLQQQQNTMKTAETALTQSKQTLDQVNKELVAANQKLATAKTQFETAQTQSSDAEKAVQAKQAELVTGEQAVTTAQTALDQAKAQLTEAEKQVAELTKQSSEQPDNADLKTQLEAATKSVAEKQQTVQAATKAVTDQTAARDGLKKQVADLTTKAQQAQQQLAKSKQEFEAATKAATDTQTKVNQATEVVNKKTQELEAIKVEVAKADTELKAAEKAKTDAETAEKAAQAVAKSTEDARKAAEKAFTDADNAAKPKNINFTPPTIPVVVEVLPAPVKLAATVPNGGKVKKGEQMEVTVNITRQNGFAGPVKLALATPPGVNGVSADVVEVPADQAEGKIVIKTSGEGPDGAIANVVIRTEADFNGKAEVDAPITLELTN